MTLKFNLQIGHLLLSLDISITVFTGIFTTNVNQSSLMCLTVKVQDVNYRGRISAILDTETEQEERW